MVAIPSPPIRIFCFRAASTTSRGRRTKAVVPVSVAVAFYLPWLEIFCALGLVFRFLYGGALSILSASIVVFTLATIAAKVRGLDITCGCFGHASQHWSFASHLATNLAILVALLALFFAHARKRGVRQQ